MASASEIKNLLDNELKPDKLGKTFEEINKNAIGFFQKLFVEQLNFDLIEGDFGEIGEDIPIDDWNKAAEAQKAYLISEKDDFRIIYVNIKKISRHRERSAISSLKRENWAIKGEYICVFYTEDSAIWHMVCPHYTEGRTILRRYVLGEGENHRTASINLLSMDASIAEPLFERVQKAFRVQVVTEDFYERYKGIFNEIKEHLTDQGIENSKAKKFTHLMLNRLMFIYFIQKKGWINNDKNFMENFLNKYINSGEKERFYDKWLKKLFFVAMSNPISEKSINEFDKDVNNILNNIPFLNGGLFEENEVDILDFSLSDDLLFMIINNFLEEYNFTITEESPFDLDIAIDPAMLGKIYESLIAEEERGKAGIFYTPRIEVDLMCRLGVYKYLLQEKDEFLTKKNIKLKQSLIKFIFIPLEEWNPEESKDFEFLREKINSIKIVDPACGSGAFLVGMLQVLIELYMKLGVPPNYELRENIIYNSLYGVDIKDWAVRMAEFRLWLSLIENEEKIPNKSPILPNFSFKLQCGDSIVQKIGNTQFDLKKHRKKLSNKLESNLNEILRLKKRFFEGDKKLYEEIKKKQINIIIENLKNENKKLATEIKQKTQQTLDGDITNESKKILKQNNEIIKENDEIIKKLENRDIDKLFFWDLNYPEIMLFGGFDIVIANPPYVRHEAIINPQIDPDEVVKLVDSELNNFKKEYKDDVINYVKKSFNFDVGKTSDLYLYFFFKSIELLTERGTLVFISSNSWLDVKFGKFLQEGLLKFSNIEYIIDNRAKKSFEEAEINTIITVLQKKTDINVLSGYVKFIAFKKPFENIINLNTLNDFLISFKEDDLLKLDFYNQELFLKEYDSFRKIILSEKSLWNLAGGTIDKLKLDEKNIKYISTGKYNESKWGKFLIAPDIYFNILYKNGDKLKPLTNKNEEEENQIAKISYGLKTGKNEFFHLGKPRTSNLFFRSEMDKKTGDLLLFLKSKKNISQFSKYYKDESQPIFNIEKEYWMHKEDEDLKKIEEMFQYYYLDTSENIWVPNYLIKSPKEIDSLIIIPKKMKTVLLYVHQPKNKLKPGVLKYIKWGESKRYHRGATCSKRNLWYELYQARDDEILCMMLIGDRYIFPYNKYKLYYDPTIDGIKFKNFQLIYLIILNSSLYPLFIELEGRTNLGGGALQLKVYEYENILTFKNNIIDSMDEDDKNELNSIFINYDLLSFSSLFEDFGTKDPDSIDIKIINEGRKRVDKIVLNKLLNLSKAEQMELYQSILRLIKTRLEKAKNK